MRLFQLFGAAVFLSVSFALAADSTLEPLTNKQVIDMLSAGIGEDLVREKITTTPCSFDTTSKAMIELKKNDVSDGIIQLMLKQHQQQVKKSRSKLSLEVQNLASKTANVRDSAFIFVQRSGMAAVPVLNKALSSVRPELRAAAALALGKLRRKESAKIIRTMLDDSDLNVRLRAGEALGILKDETAILLAHKNIVAGGSKLEGHIRLLGTAKYTRSTGFLSIRLLEDPSETARQQSAWALGEIKAAKGVKSLAHALTEDSSEGVMRESAMALGKIADPSTLQALFDTCKKRANIRAECLQAISNFAPEKAVEFLIFSLKIKLKESERRIVLDGLRKLTHQNFGPNVEQWIQWLQKNKDKLRDLRKDQEGAMLDEPREDIRLTFAGLNSKPLPLAGNFASRYYTNIEESFTAPAIYQDGGNLLLDVSAPVRYHDKPVKRPTIRSSSTKATAKFSTDNYWR